MIAYFAFKIDLNSFLLARYLARLGRVDSLAWLMLGKPTLCGKCLLGCLSDKGDRFLVGKDLSLHKSVYDS
jgi:hypothetical protein